MLALQKALVFGGTQPRALDPVHGSAFVRRVILGAGQMMYAVREIPRRFARGIDPAATGFTPGLLNVDDDFRDRPAARN